MSSVALLSVAQLQQAQAGGAGPYIVVDARPRGDYLAGHLPGAVHLAWEEWCAPGPVNRHPITAEPGYWGLLAADGVTASSASWYAAKLAGLGLVHDRPIAVYAGGATSKGREGRVAWMLLYLGAHSVFLLDGGWPAWLQSGGPATGEETIPPRGSFVVDPQKHRRARLDDLRRAYHAGTLPLLIDTRDQDEFDGRLHPYMPRMGHLPTAVLVTFDRLFTPSGHYVSADAYRRAMPPALRAAVAAVTYCEVGVRAATVALLHEIHTGRSVATYDGSLMEWSLDPTLPVSRS